MNIIVCVKQVPDTTQIKLNPETHTLIRDGVENILNPYDAEALETALILKDKYGGDGRDHGTAPGQGNPEGSHCQGRR